MLEDKRTQLFLFFLFILILEKFYSLFRMNLKRAVGLLNAGNKKRNIENMPKFH